MHADVSCMLHARRSGQDCAKVVIDEAYVMQRLGDLLKKQDLSRYIL